MSRKRLLFGLAVMLLVQLVVSNFSTSIFAAAIPDMAMQSALTFFLAAFAGGVVARCGFVLPALGVWLVLWVAIVFTLYQIAAPLVQAPWPSIFQHNWVAFVLSGVATGVAAYLGQRLSGTGKDRVAAT